jgi:hypothetical protein
MIFKKPSFLLENDGVDNTEGNHYNPKNKYFFTEKEKYHV